MAVETFIRGNIDGAHHPSLRCDRRRRDASSDQLRVYREEEIRLYVPQTPNPDFHPDQYQGGEVVVYLKGDCE